MRFNLLVLNVLTLVLAGCTGGGDPGNEHIIGDKLKDVAPLTTSTGADQTRIAMYDPTVNRIHQFNLLTNELERSVQVALKGQEHYVLYDQSSNYIIDLTKDGFNIFDKDNQIVTNPITLVGKPVSAAFRPSLGLLVIYDDLMSVGVLKLDVDGHVVKAKVFGSAFGPDTISAGDMDETGRLILAMSSGQIKVVDLDASLTSGTWTATTVNTALDNVRWLYPVRGQPNQVLVRVNEKLAVVNLATAAVTNGPDVPEGKVIYYGKSPDGHVIYRDKSDDALIHVAYVSGGAVVKKQVAFAPNYIMNSRLDITNDSWTLIAAKSAYYNYDKLKYEYSGRSLRRWGFDSLVATANQGMPDKAKFELNSTRAFALYPVKMGRATNYNLVNRTSRELLYFNMPYID